MSCPNSFKEICKAFLDEAMEYNDLPGLVVGVAMEDRTFVGARGVRDVVTGDPLQADDIFHCASVSKLFTSTAIMKLVDAGVLSLDDRLCDILPNLFGNESINERVPDQRWMNIRLWQMLSHTAGIGDVDDYHWEEALTSDDALSEYVHSDEVVGQPLLWEPGEGGFRYSNIAYEILGHIVAVKSAEYIRRIAGKADVQERIDQAAMQGLSYEDFVQRFLMEPAGMTDSTMLTFLRLGLRAGDRCPLITDEIRHRNATNESGAIHRAASDVPAKAGTPTISDTPWHPMALPHEKSPDRNTVPIKYYPYTRSHAPSSTLTSNAADLLKWARVHLAEFAAPESPPTATTPLPPLQIRREYAEVPNNREKMGLGWFMRRQGGYQLYGHEGTDDGFRASFWICPERELGIVVLSNLSGAPVKKLNRKLFERLTE